VLTNAAIERQMKTNVCDVVNVLRAAAPLARQQRAGHIINVGSTAGTVGFTQCKRLKRQQGRCRRLDVVPGA
jgi:NAD(P)-dependent dehydrogenase (short-subunit alcohol dehydrogenase family)